MGSPRLAWDEIPLAMRSTTTRRVDLWPMARPQDYGLPSVVNMGNPHAIFLVPDLSASIPLETVGPQIEVHADVPREGQRHVR